MQTIRKRQQEFVNQSKAFSEESAALQLRVNSPRR
jgi:hypothetical protein